MDLEQIKNIFLLSFFILSSLFSTGQNPLMKMWDYRYGGYGIDIPTGFQRTSDGGYILGGKSRSDIGGDKTQNTWGNIYDTDYWIVKLDAMGIKQWDKDFGGTEADELYSIQQTADGGYILGGYSSSGISGNKTQPLVGSIDYWIVKTDASGNIQWDHDYGGTEADWFTSLTQTADGGYIIGGTTLSGIGGNKTQPLWGGMGQDIWILKIDSVGNIEWDKDIGGTNGDWLACIRQTDDGGYALGCYSASDISGDKSEGCWGGYEDYWIVKLDSTGVKQWDKVFGGTNSDRLYDIIQTTDHGFLLGGRTQSDLSGNKTTPVWFGSGNYDLWIVKTDSLGTKQWEKDIGGYNFEDEFGYFFKTNDGGYLLSGTSYSTISGDKSENNLGYEQSWMLKTDALGNIQWDKTVLTDGHDEAGYGVQSMDGCYVLVNYSAFGSGIAGHKTQANWSADADYWIVKFCDTTAIPVAGFTAPHHICPGTCIDFVNLSVNATSYQWIFQGGTPPMSVTMQPTGICYNTPGTYEVTLIAINGSQGDTISLANYITVYPYPPPQGIQQNGDTLFANAGAVTYQWYFNGNILAGATNSFYIAPACGDYNVVAADFNGCEVEAAMYNVVANTSSWSNRLSITVFPNPVNQFLVIAGMSEVSGIELAVSDILGQIVPLHFSYDSQHRLKIDVHTLPPGMYSLVIRNAEKSFRSKFVKE
ncbi:MAG TPA: T9SS type A sorting domain-containing protein [Chitinophagaceae bacterium]|nr:T9SS type A sorting domain-containing protein [Chitinophagaceae bacterium]